MRLTLISATALAAFAILAPLALAGTRTYYVSPAGSGAKCSEDAPCELEYASEEVVNEDAIVVLPGTYEVTGPIGINREVDVGGLPGAAVPLLETSGSGFLYAGVGLDRPHFHDLRIEGAHGIAINGASAERLYVSVADGDSACGISIGGVLRDSVCWVHGSGAGNALGPQAAGETGTVTLRNVTAIATNAAGDAIHARTTDAGPKLVVNATNVIARATGHPDVEADLGGFGFPVIEVDLTHSNYLTVSGEQPPLATITPPGSNGNQTAPPAFVGAASGDFGELAASPTVDAGATEALDGPTALGGEARTLAACLGGQAITDIGAYEFVPTVACGGPPPIVPVATPAPSAAPSSKIGFGKLKLNKSKGTATLVVKLPGAGSLTASGKGAKKVSRSVAAAGQLRLPIKATGKAKQKLSQIGAAMLKLQVRFAPTGGVAATVPKTVSLKETLH